jgi:DNA polymerase III delta subunit
MIIICGCSNLEKETLAALQASEYTFIEKECKLNDNFADEPEFYTFVNTEFCSAEIDIIQIESISPSQSIVDYRITFMAKQPKLKKWLRSYEAMEARKLPSPKQQQIKALIEKITQEKRDWIYSKQTVKLNLTEDGWIIQDVIR